MDLCFTLCDHDELGWKFWHRKVEKRREMRAAGTSDEDFRAWLNEERGAREAWAPENRLLVDFGIEKDCTLRVMPRPIDCDCTSNGAPRCLSDYGGVQVGAEGFPIQLAKARDVGEHVHETMSNSEYLKKKEDANH